ncbi:MAG: acyl-CoA dehydrogenase family protein [Thermodesulfobacteriota bacterium]
MRSDPEKILRRTMARFVDQEVIPRAREMDEKAVFPREMFKKLAEMGCFSIRYPRQAGGGGGNTTLFCIMCEELARGYMSLAAITAMQCLMGTNFLFHYGTDELKKKYFYPAMDGEMVASFALTEPEAATDLSNVRTLAEKTPDGWLINGMKTWITNAPVADFFTVLCQTQRGSGLKGLNFFFIPRTTPGVSTSKKFDKLGTRATEISELAFKDVLIPHHHLLGQEGQGMRNLFSILAVIRIMTAALAVGLARAAYAASVKYSNERQQFGRTIGKFQLIQSKIANMATQIWASHLMTYEAARLVDSGQPATKESSMAKYFATETACMCADEATRIFGSYAYSMEYDVQRFYRDNRFLLYGGGTHEILQTNISRECGVY